MDNICVPFSSCPFVPFSPIGYLKHVHSYEMDSKTFAVKCELMTLIKTHAHWYGRLETRELDDRCYPGLDYVIDVVSKVKAADMVLANAAWLLETTSKVIVRVRGLGLSLGD